MEDRVENDGSRNDMLTRRAVLTGGVAAAAAGGMWHFGSGILVQSYRHVVREDGAWFRIGFLSDPHVVEPWFSMDRWRDCVNQVNRLGVDMVVFGGDYSGYNIPYGKVVDAQAIGKVAGLARAPYGVFAIMGNHDHVADGLLGGTWGGLSAVERGFGDAGVPVLRNRSVHIPFGAGFWLAGLDSQVVWGDGKVLADLGQTLSGIGDEAPVVLLAHEPDVFAAHDPRIALQLSGHMHGGQVRFGDWTPGPLPSRFGKRYLHGLINEAGQSLIVSGGLGYSRVPMRIGARPELTLVEVKI